MMNYYTLPKIGKGTSEDPYRPDVPEGTSFVGNVGADAEYLIATPLELTAKTGRTKQPPRQALENACKAKSIKYDDAVKWSVS